MEFGVCSLEFGVWRLEFGAWSLEFGAWSLPCYGGGAVGGISMGGLLRACNLQVRVNVVLCAPALASELRAR